MAAAQMLLAIGTAPPTPSAGKVALYAKSDKKLYAKDDTGLETPLLGTTPPGAFIKGTDGSITAGNAGIAGSVRNSAGNYSVMLATPITLAALAVPQVSLTGGSNGEISYDLATPPPCSQINVFTYDSSGTPADHDFAITVPRV